MAKIAFPQKSPIEYRTEIHCRFSVATMKRLAEIAEATGNHLNRTVAILVDTILPYVQIETVTEPCQRVFIETPDGVVMARKEAGK
jgi:pyruvate kinase